MSDFTQGGGASRFATYGVSTSTSAGTLVTASASANTKGSYVELASSTDFNAQGIFVCFNKKQVSDRYWVDIAVGAAGSETVIISNIVLRDENADGVHLKMYFPISIPAGSRLSARCQGDVGSVSMYVSVIICSGGVSNQPVYSGVESIGLKHDTDGTYFLTSSLSANTKSAWQEMTSSTSHPIRAIDIIFSNYWSASDAYHLFDIGIGAAGSEQVLISNIADVNRLSRNVNMVNSGIIPCSIPSGTRISYRGQTDVPGSGCYFVLSLYGYY